MTPRPRRTNYVMVFVIAVMLLPDLIAGQAVSPNNRSSGTCDFSGIPGVIWWGTDPQMTIREFAAYSAPVFWPSPDEPTLDGKTGVDIRIPSALPFEEIPDSPVVYYQYNQILEHDDHDGAAYIADSTDKNNSQLHLRGVAAVDLKYIAYFPREEGVGAHPHDIEPTAFRIEVHRSSGTWMSDHPGIACDEETYIIRVSRVTGEAHGFDWFYNIVVVDEGTRFPMHLMVEEGKHAMCTDKNSDGHFTPGYDVNRRVNDAWGVRDIIRGGVLFSGKYEGYMSKVRQNEHRVFPPLPDDSPLRAPLVVDGEYAPGNAVYELRAFPGPAGAEGDVILVEKITEKYEPGWPDVASHTSLKSYQTFLKHDLALKSYALSGRYAGGDLGLVLVFPLLFVKNVENPLSGGWITQRLYVVGSQGLRDIGWGLQFMPSASRWFDTYLAMGVESDQELRPDSTKDRTAVFTAEIGFKLRVNTAEAPPPVKWLSYITRYWGVRFGVQNKGWPSFNRVDYIIEFGAGVF